MTAPHTAGPTTARPPDRGPTWVLSCLARNQASRYTMSLAVWIFIWTSPVLLGVAGQQFFDGLSGEGGWAVDVVAWVLAGWAVVHVVGIFTGMRLHAALMVRARAGMQRRMLAWLFGLPAANPVAMTTGEVVSRFRDDTMHVQDAFDFTVDLLGAIVSAAVAFVLLARVDVALAVVVYTPIGVVVGIVYALGARIRLYREQARDTTEAVTGFLGEAFAGVGALKVAGAERAVGRRLEVLNEQRRRMMVRDGTLSAAVDAVVGQVAVIGTGLVMVLAAGTLAGDGPDAVSVGDVALFTLLLARVAWAASMSGRFLARTRQAGVSVDRMVSLMRGASTADVVVHDDLHAPLTEAPRPERLTGHQATTAPLLVVRGLTCLLPGGGGIRAVDLDVQAGQLVVVTGAVGSGKTTLLRGVLGLLPAQVGEVEWRGDVVEDPAALLVPPRVAYTPQVPRLLSMDLRDNLALGLGVDDDALLAAMATATLDVDLADMPDGLDTMVGTRGLRLSGGQAQRAAAARMLVRTPELLVFDDLSSALDVETEARLWENLFGHRRAGTPTTALVVSHRRPALARADHVVVLDGGRVVAAGTADELRASSAHFRALWA